MEGCPYNLSSCRWNDFDIGRPQNYFTICSVRLPTVAASAGGDMDPACHRLPPQMVAV